MTNNSKSDLNYKDISYEEAFSRLKLIVEKLQQDNNISLKDMVNLYKEGKLLSDRCEELLNSAKFEIEEVMNTEKNNNE